MSIGRIKTPGKSPGKRQLRLLFFRNQELVAGVDEVRIPDFVDRAEGLYSGAVALCENTEAVTRLDDVYEAGTVVCAAVDVDEFIFIESIDVFHLYFSFKKYFSFLP